MQTIEEVRAALERLPLDERMAIIDWLWDLNTGGGRYGVREPGAAYAPAEPLFMTPEEYLEFEQRSEIRHEYVDGFVYAMLGPTLAHQRIAHRLTVAFDKHVGRGPCRAFSHGSLLQIRRETSRMYYYPDVMVDCRRDMWDENSVRNPKLIVEVLSPSTQLVDRREKFHNYQSIDSVEEYALAAQDEYKVTIHRRASGWRPQVYAGAQAAAEFRSIGLVVPLSEVYDDMLDG